MALYFDSETIFVKAYQELGDIEIKDVEPGTTIDGIIINDSWKGAKYYKSPFYNSDNVWNVLREYANILREKLNELDKRNRMYPLKNILKDPCIAWREGSDFADHLEMYGDITTIKIENVNRPFEKYPEVLACMEEASKELKQKLISKIDLNNINKKNCFIIVGTFQFDF